MKRFRKYIRPIHPKYGRYSFLVLKNRWNSLFINGQQHKYLFILSPPYCGSTLLNEIISSGGAVSVNNPFGTREGQTLPTVRRVMFDHPRRWDRSLDFDWGFIKKEWRKYWDLDAAVLLEKSPPSIIRAKSIEKNFDPAFFIVFHRNPYAHCESLIRRNNVKPQDAAIFAIKCLTYQKENLLKLKRTTQISYEDLTTDTAMVREALVDFLPELTDMNYQQNFSAHNYLGQKMKISNLNGDKINKLTEVQLEEINSVFNRNRELLNYFDYPLIQAS